MFEMTKLEEDLMGKMFTEEELDIESAAVKTVDWDGTPIEITFYEDGTIEFEILDLDNGDFCNMTLHIDELRTLANFAEYFIGEIYEYQYGIEDEEDASKELKISLEEFLDTYCDSPDPNAEWYS